MFYNEKLDKDRIRKIKKKQITRNKVRNKIFVSLKRKYNRGPPNKQEQKVKLMETQLYKTLL